MNPFQGIIDTLRNSNKESIREYRCFTCGEHKPMTWENEYWVNDSGETICAQVCNKCKAKGRHKLLP